MQTISFDFTDSGETIATNSDHSIDQAVVSLIKGQKLYADYTGWNFYGKIWWEHKRWFCEIWTHRCHRETMSAKTIRELMNDISDKYGWD